MMRVFDAIKNEEGEECSNFLWKENFVGVALVRENGVQFFRDDGKTLQEKKSINHK